MRWLLKVPVVLVGILMLSMGLRWLLAPSGVATELGMPLLEGVGLATQIGDLSAFFLTIGLCILLGLSTGRTHWFYPAIMLLSLTALGRVLAWLLHDAVLTAPAIVVEVVSSILLIAAVTVLPDRNSGDTAS